MKIPFKHLVEKFRPLRGHLLGHHDFMGLTPSPLVHKNCKIGVHLDEDLGLAERLEAQGLSAPLSPAWRW